MERTRSWVSWRGWRAFLVLSLLGLLAGGVVFAVAANQSHATPIPVTGAAFTTVDENLDGQNHCQNGNPLVNCNIYDGKQFVWMNGGPIAAGLGDGTYFFAVLDPGSQLDPNDGATGNLSSPNDAYTNRTFTVSGGTVTYTGDGISPPHDTDGNKVRLMPYDDTDNPGGVYILAICSLANTYPVSASDCKFDAFKVNTGTTTNDGMPLTITKDASGVDTNTYTWSIQKAVDKTKVEQLGGSATFHYTVTVSHDSGAITGVKVSGTIEVTNPNVDASSNPVSVMINGVTDKLSDGTVCSVTNGGSQTLTQVNTGFAYSCDLSALPTGELDNTATVTWPEQFLDNGALLAGDTASFMVTDITFTPTLVDNCVAVTDTFAGALGTVCVGDANPTVFPYSRTIAIPQFGCLNYDNTATFTTNTTGTTGSAGQTVTVCGPAHTGALTMGFWHNKNGQGIITASGPATGVCTLTTWLRQFAPFQDLAATSTCKQVAAYDLTVFNNANASGATMNAMLKAQMLSTALDVYFSDPVLGGNKINAPAPIGGVKIDLTKICHMIDGSGGSATCGGAFEDASPAFGGASSLTVSQMLTYAASQSNVGGTTWYLQSKATQQLAKDAFDAINNQVAFSV